MWPGRERCAGSCATSRPPGHDGDAHDRLLERLRGAAAHLAGADGRPAGPVLEPAVDLRDLAAPLVGLELATARLALAAAGPAVTATPDRPVGAAA